MSVALEKSIQSLEDEAKDIKHKIDNIISEISTNKEKYMPAVTLINELKVHYKELMKDIHDMHLQLSQSDARLEASTSSAHKRIDSASDIVESLKLLPNQIRKDFMKLGGSVLFLIISFGVWTETTLMELKVSDRVNSLRIEKLEKQADKNTLITSKLQHKIK